jgi:hypothetical protein
VALACTGSFSILLAGAASVCKAASLLGPIKSAWLKPVAENGSKKLTQQTHKQTKQTNKQTKKTDKPTYKQTNKLNK